MKSKVVAQIEEMLKGVTDADEIAEIEKVITEVKVKVPVEPVSGFWVGKRPCWEMCQCPETIRKECPALKYQSLPCWEIEGTYCKLDDYGNRGDDTSICEVCRVYKRWGTGKPIEMKLLGRGINTLIKSIGKMARQEEVEVTK